jgi:hypothetical protein
MERKENVIESKIRKSEERRKVKTEMIITYL